MNRPIRPPPVIGSGSVRGGLPPPRMAPATRAPAVTAHFRKPPAPVTSRQSLLLPDELERFKNLLVFARSTVEGYFIGKHKSPYQGSSVEFTDYKEYVPGDEVNRIDWRAYARSRRLFVRQYEAETDMVVYLLVDVSASMNYAGAGRQSKYIMAAKIASALGYLMIHQGDKAALGLFAESLSRFIAPGGTRRHLYNLVSELDAVEPAEGTGISEALRQCDPLFKKRGRIVILSDFWTDQAELMDALARFQHRKFEILLLQMLDPDELNLPPAESARFQDMESQEEVEVELEEIRVAYRGAMKDRVEQLAREAGNRAISHAVINTWHPYLEAIEAYLGFRGHNPMGRGA